MPLFYISYVGNWPTYILEVKEPTPLDEHLKIKILPHDIEESDNVFKYMYGVEMT